MRVHSEGEVNEEWEALLDPFSKRVVAAVDAAMNEAGFDCPSWFADFDDPGSLFCMAPDDKADEDERYRVALDRAVNLVADGIGWPGT